MWTDVPLWIPLLTFVAGVLVVLAIQELVAYRRRRRYVGQTITIMHGSSPGVSRKIVAVSRKGTITSDIPWESTPDSNTSFSIDTKEGAKE